jgi:hypothetical protein
MSSKKAPSKAERTPCRNDLFRIATYLKVPHKTAASWRRHGGGETDIFVKVNEFFFNKARLDKAYVGPDNLASFVFGVVTEEKCREQRGA